MSESALMRSSALMAAGTVTSRLLGLARISLLGAALTLVGASASAFDVANKIPANVYMLVAGGVLNAVLVPQVVRASRAPDGGRGFTDRLLTVAALGLVVVGALATACAPLLVALYSSSEWSGEQLALATAFAFWSLPQVVFLGMYALLGQVLNARGSFGPYMWAPVANNVVAITVLVAYVALVGRGDRPPGAWTPGEVALLAGGSSLGVAVQAAVLVPVLRRSGFGWRPRLGLRGVGLSTAGVVAGWALAGLAVRQVGFVPISRVTTYAGEAADFEAASNFAYTYAYLVFMLPHSIITVSLATALLTSFSRKAADGDTAGVRRDVVGGITSVLVLILPATAALVVLAEPIARVLLPGNPLEETQALALVIAGMALGLPAFSTTYLVHRAFYAYQDARTPFLMTCLVVAVTTAGVVLAGSMLAPEVMVAGVGVAMSVGATAGAVVSLALLRRRLGGLGVLSLVGALARVGVSTVVSSAAGFGAFLGVRALIADGESRPADAVALLGAGVVVLGLHLLLCRLLGVAEVTAVLGLVRRRLGRGARSRSRSREGSPRDHG